MVYIQVVFLFPVSTAQIKGLLCERHPAVAYLEGCKSHTYIVKSDGHMSVWGFYPDWIKMMR